MLPGGFCIYADEADGYDASCTWRLGGADWKPWWALMLAPYIFPGYDIGAYSAPKALPSPPKSLLKCSLHYKAETEFANNPVMAKREFSYHMNQYWPDRLDAVVHPSQAIWIYDSQYYGYPFFTSTRSFTFNGNTIRSGHFRHNRKLNVAFSDGHVESLLDYPVNAAYTSAGYFLDGTK